MPPPPLVGAVIVRGRQRVFADLPTAGLFTGGGDVPATYPADTAWPAAGDHAAACAGPLEACACTGMHCKGRHAGYYEGARWDQE